MKKNSKAILPAGFQANGVSCGLKKSGKLDLALIYSQVPAVACAKFTKNRIIAAPLVLSKKHLNSAKGFQAIIVNSGNANCFTGLAGLNDAFLTAGRLARELGIPVKSVLVNSTGIIGKRLDVAKIKKAIPGLVCGLSAQGLHKATAGIMTTDTFAKEMSIDLSISGKKVRICAVAKGAGMIAPDMATMLCFIMTDGAIKKEILNDLLTCAVEKSFNCISVDGCMSTNDTVLAMANGMAGNKIISEGRDLQKFSEALDYLCQELARMVVLDAEGATKFIQIDVEGAKDQAQAKKAALSIANSMLFKAAMYGNNPNFGRIAAAVGSSGISINEGQLKIKLGPLENKKVNLKVSLSQGKAKCRVFTSDLSPEYVRINAEYN